MSDALTSLPAGGWRVRFHAIGGPCELLIEPCERTRATTIVTLVTTEVARIEQRYSRYRPDSIVHAINHSGGQPIELDDESARLIDYAEHCYQLSEGQFDITAGILRRVWSFSAGAALPTPAAITQLLPLIGWQQVVWQRPLLSLPAGMEIDLGGIGKEYAADRALNCVIHSAQLQGRPPPILLNLGGDLRASAPPRSGYWQVGVDDPAATGQAQVGRIGLKVGALATSGDARRSIVIDGQRYSHILNPRTGWPVAGAPRSVTVAAPNCLEAGMLATLAMLRGEDAAPFLQAQGVQHWLVD